MDILLKQSNCHAHHFFFQFFMISFDVSQKATYKTDKNSQSFDARKSNDLFYVIMIS